MYVFLHLKIDTIKSYKGDKALLGTAEDFILQLIAVEK